MGNLHRRTNDFFVVRNSITVADARPIVVTAWSVCKRINSYILVTEEKNANIPYMYFIAC